MMKELWYILCYTVPTPEAKAHFGAKAVSISACAALMETAYKSHAVRSNRIMILSWIFLGCQSLFSK